jgi:hypothetical protein
MTRPARLARPVALGAVVLVLLAACQGRTPGASPRSTASTVAVTPSASAASSSRVVMGSLTLVFDTPIPANATQAQVIRDYRRAQILWERSSDAHRLVVPTTDYVTGSALANLLRVLRPACRQLACRLRYA